METISHLSDTGKAVVLAPHYCFTNRRLWAHIESAELVNPKVFEDANITEELLVCTLVRNEINDNPDYLRECTVYDKEWRSYYAYNKKHYEEYIKFQFKVIFPTPEAGYKYIESLGKDRCVYIHRRQTHGFNTTQENYSFKLNAGLSNIRDVPFTGNNKNKDGSYKDYMWALSIIIFKNSEARNAFFKWKDTSAFINDAIAGLHTNGSIKLALPQVDFSSVNTDEEILRITKS